MRQFLFYLLLIVVLSVSCDKPDDNDKSLQPKLEFTINGITYNRDGVNVGGDWVNGPEIYKDNVGTYQLHQGNLPEPAIAELEICKCSITSGSYPSGVSGSEIKYNNKPYSGTGAHYTITVTAVSNGLATGTFSGTFSAYLTPSDVINVTGKFSNVPIIP